MRSSWSSTMALRMRSSLPKYGQNHGQNVVKITVKIIKSAGATGGRTAGQTRGPKPRHRRRKAVEWRGGPGEQPAGEQAGQAGRTSRRLRQRSAAPAWSNRRSGAARARPVKLQCAESVRRRPVGAGRGVSLSLRCAFGILAPSGLAGAAEAVTRCNPVER